MQLSKLEQQNESMAIFIAGQILGLASQLNIRALEKFLASDRSKGDFKYTKQCRDTIEFYKKVFEK